MLHKNIVEIMFQIVDVVPAIVGNVFARAVAHEWQVSNSSHQNSNGQMISQNGNSTAVSNSVSSSKGVLSFKLTLIWFSIRVTPSFVFISH